MKFTLAFLGLAATALAMPQVDGFSSSNGPQGDGVGNSNGAATANGAGAGNGVGNQGNSQVRFAVPDDVTVKQASEKCGDNTQLSCCNKAVAAGDSTSISEGPLADGLRGLLGGDGSGSQGLGLFEQCGKLTVIPISMSIFTFTRLQYLTRNSWRSHQPALQAERCLLPEERQLLRKHPLPLHLHDHD